MSCMPLQPVPARICCGLCALPERCHKGFWQKLASTQDWCAESMSTFTVGVLRAFAAPYSRCGCLPLPWRPPGWAAGFYQQHVLHCIARARAVACDASLLQPGWR